ncbi:MAG: adenosylmethionine--8-amino-7-oxononanoate transaminase [Cyclobacteriaceae bacterium]|nr:adenosylmethionine--8-amino-7-oxononanoate transaminase [Cyclobacteriaceae bacterium]MDH4295855.1 adenosylmethionine--8-amino-7-oxononanoate transaminase [Cyclobacteriaceae bacterium]MDH5249603.1 adenosylmethionine--8-amino-7-oxononanoate transaminase [Cyclobacteriaceae bacterium]
MNNLLRLDSELIWHPFTPLTGSPQPILVDSASGVYIHTHDGRKIIDAVSSWWVNLHGHANTYIAEAIAAQAKKLEHVIFAGFTHEPAIHLAQNLLNILPANQSKVFFSDNGSTAVEVGLKMAFQFWHNQGITKKKIIAIKGAYHGDTFGAMSVGERGMFTNPFSNYLFDVAFIDFPYPDKEQEVLDQFRALLLSKEIGAFIFEPLVQGASGMRMYSPAILDLLLSAAKKSDVVCIADEVFTGFGRTGKMFASDYLNEMPDIVSVSKGITGGTLPLGVTSCSARIVSAFTTNDFTKTFFHGHSYTANPIACAAANASFELLNKKECQEQISRIAAQHQSFKRKMQYHKNIKEARCQGTILALELKAEAESSYANDLRKKIYPFFLERNILLRPLGNVIYVLPPYVITNEQLNEVYDAIAEFLDTF